MCAAGDDVVVVAKTDVARASETVLHTLGGGGGGGGGGSESMRQYVHPTPTELDLAR